jgi:hypothetical protein
MKKITLALLLIAAFCLFAVSPVMAATDPYAIAKNTTAKYAFGIAGKNVVSFPTATYVPSSVKPSALVPLLGSTTKTGLDVIFAVPAMSGMTTSIGGNYFVVTKFPWEL